jgi:AcrR family transcriptional regulator
MESDTDMQHPGAAPRTDTRSRVQQVALELFAEQGYEKTSLREIAERLGVTKAALYYHFKSKEDIVHSFTDDHFAMIDELIDWARAQPPGEETKHEILDRYVRIVFGGAPVFRFIEQNRAAMQGMEHGDKADRLARFRSRLDAIVELLAGPDPTLRARVRATASLISASGTCMLLWDSNEDPAEMQAIALEIATDLIG